MILTQSAGASWISNNLEATIALVALAASVLGFLLTLWLKRKQIKYRVHLDTPIGLMPQQHGDDMIEVQLRNKGELVPDPSFALVRIMNTGSLEIDERDIRLPLTLKFDGRTVVDAQFVEKNYNVTTVVADEPTWPVVGGTELVLPKVPLNRRDKIKVLVLLSGKPASERPDVECDGFIAGGRIVRDTTRGDGPDRRKLVFGGIALLLIGASIALLTTINGDKTTPAVKCATGTLKVSGSSAFEPVTEKIVEKYRQKCGDATITVDGPGSIVGLQDLGPRTRDQNIAMSDGVAPFGTQLTPRSIAVIPYTVVVNKKVGLSDLTAAQLREIFTGEKTNWKELGGPDLPISVVSRDGQSGTRQAFERIILDKQSEPSRSSLDCVSKINPSTKILRCELNSTSRLLETVEKTDGAIGYADLPAISGRTGLQSVKIDGVAPTKDSMAKNDYRFWVVEYFYSFGRAEDGSLVDLFLEYMTSEEAKDLLRENEFFPCGDPWLDPDKHPCDTR